MVPNPKPVDKLLAAVIFKDGDGQCVFQPPMVPMWGVEWQRLREDKTMCTVLISAVDEVF